MRSNVIAATVLYAAASPELAEGFLAALRRKRSADLQAGSRGGLRPAPRPAAGVDAARTAGLEASATRPSKPSLFHSHGWAPCPYALGMTAASRIIVFALLFAAVLPVLAAAADTAQKAGNISALLPTANIVRGAGKAATSSEAKKGDEVIWNDLVRTEKAGRARVTLLDQSILSIGSDAELRIVKHDARSQQTLLELKYGQIRAEVSKVKPKGNFEVRTPTAVAGVIGTDFGVNFGSDSTEFVCLSGSVVISNSDPGVPGQVSCLAGQTVTVVKGSAPSNPKPATFDQINGVIQQTEPALISALLPASAPPGATLDATLAGPPLASISAVMVSGTGLQATLNPGGTTAATSVHLVVDPQAVPGPRTVSFTGANGNTTAALFTIVGKPASAAAATTQELIAPLLTVFPQEQQSTQASLDALVAGMQQVADQMFQEIEIANRTLPGPLDISPALADLRAQVTAIATAITAVQNQIGTPAAAALSEFNNRCAALNSALLQRNPAGVPDEAFTSGLNAAFGQVNAAFLALLQGLPQPVTAGIPPGYTQLTQIRNYWLAQISQAGAGQSVLSNSSSLLQVDHTELAVPLGAQASFDASLSGAGSNSVAYQWALCDPSYTPSQVGVPLAATAGGCTALSGYVSSSSQFIVPTCALQPGDYAARLTAIDSSRGISSAMDVRFSVLAPAYDDPLTQLLHLTAAYSSLHVDPFMQFFDPASYPGYAMLQENVRSTLQALNSMNINLQVAAVNINCNEATMRTTWNQSYSFTSHPKQIFTQTEQLTVRFERIPGTGWLISDFQGDNGTVQGLPPAIANLAAPVPANINILSDHNNAAPVGSTPPAVVEINGLLAETVNLEAVPVCSATAGTSCSGAANLLFADSAAIAGNVTGSNGNYVQSSTTLSNVAYNVYTPVMFAAVAGSNGEITAEPATVLVSAAAVPSSPPGGQQTQLAFNIGDIDILVPPCTYLTPSASTPFVLQWLPVNGFNPGTLSWSWTSLPSGITASMSAGTTSGSGSYPNLALTLINSNPADLGGAVSANFQVAISNASGTVVKNFAIPLNLAAGVCPALAGPTGGTRTQVVSRQAVGGPLTRIRGSWNKAAMSSREVPLGAPALPDLRLSASDIVYTPSLPKPGDRLEIRFRVTNAGSADGLKVPIALRVNHAIVTSDTFDVAAGKTTLAGLEWNNAQIPVGGAPVSVVAELVIDPMQTVHQQTTLGKSATLAHFNFRGSTSPWATAARSSLVIGVGEGACLGLRFNAGASSDCASADVGISVEDLSAGRYAFMAPSGIADLGYVSPGTTAQTLAQAGFAPEATPIAGHSYAVRLRSGKVGILTLRAIRNPQQKRTAVGKVFNSGGMGQRRGGPVALGGSSRPVETGDVAPIPQSEAKAYFELSYEVP